MYKWFRCKILCVVVCVLVVALDQASKVWASSALVFDPLQANYPPIILFDYGISLSLALAKNTGCAWNLFCGHPFILSLVRIGIILALITFLFSSKCRRLYRLPLSLILAGAVSNLYEMLVYGHVTDMISVTFWGWPYPIFNIADSAICVGVVLFLWVNFFGDVRADSSSK